MLTEEVKNLFHEHHEWARKLARNLWARLPGHSQGGDLESLEAAADSGLLEACQRWRKGGAPFRFYAARRVNGAMRDWLRDCDHLTRSFRRRARQGGQVPTIKPLALLVPRGPGQHEDGCLIDTRENGPEHTQQLRDLARLAFAVLRPRERLILTYTFWNQWTQFRIGLVLGISESRVNQLLTQALAKCRKRLEYHAEHQLDGEGLV